MLFAAVQYLLLSGVQHPLAVHYPILRGVVERPSPAAGESTSRAAAGGGRRTGRVVAGQAFPRFRAFCLEHRDAIAELVSTRGTQTQVVRRCACLLPAFALVHRLADAPLALFDVGAGAGLNLVFDRYRYRYRRNGRDVLRWGPASARVRLDAELRGPVDVPALPETIPVASRDGIDLHPVDLTDPDQLLWQRALIWPEHVERHRQLDRAMTELERSTVRLRRGAGNDLLPAMLERAPADRALLVFTSLTLYQFSDAALARFSELLAAASRPRPVWHVGLERVVDSVLTLTTYRGGAAVEEELAAASPHGWWLNWRRRPARSPRPS